jgi:hypothetical protein
MSYAIAHLSSSPARLKPAVRVLALLTTVAVPAYAFALATGPGSAAAAAVAACAAAVPVMAVNVVAASAWLDLRRAGLFPAAAAAGRAWGWAAGRYAAAVAAAFGTAAALAVAAGVTAAARVSTRSGAGIVLLGAEAALLAGVCGFDLWRSGRPDDQPVG